MQGFGRFRKAQKPSHSRKYLKSSICQFNYQLGLIRLIAEPVISLLLVQLLTKPQARVFVKLSCLKVVMFDHHADLRFWCSDGETIEAVNIPFFSVALQQRVKKTERKKKFEPWKFEANSIEAKLSRTVVCLCRNDGRGANTSTSFPNTQTHRNPASLAHAGVHSSDPP